MQGISACMCSQQAIYIISSCFNALLIGILGWVRRGDIIRAFGGFFSGSPTIERHQGVMKGKIIYFDVGESSFRM
jgi:hypothetical protein